MKKLSVALPKIYLMKSNIRSGFLATAQNDLGGGDTFRIRRIEILHEVAKLIDPNQEFVNVNISAVN